MTAKEPTNSSLSSKQITLHPSEDNHKTFVPTTRKRKGDSGSSYEFYQRFTGFGLRILCAPVILNNRDRKVLFYRSQMDCLETRG